MGVKIVSTAVKKGENGALVSNAVDSVGSMLILNKNIFLFRILTRAVCVGGGGEKINEKQNKNTIETKNNNVT